MSARICAVLAVLVCSPLTAAPPPVKPRGKNIQRVTGWGEVTDPDGDCKVLRRKRRTHAILVPKTHHDLTYQEDGTKRNAPRVTPVGRGRFHFHRHAHGDAGPNERHVIERKNTPTSSAVFLISSRTRRTSPGSSGAAVCHSQGTGPYAHTEVFSDGKSTRGQRVELGDTDATVRLTRKDKQFTFEVDPGATGKNWKSVLEFDHPLASTLKVGVFALNTTNVEYSPAVRRRRIEDEEVNSKATHEAGGGS